MQSPKSAAQREQYHQAEQLEQLRLAQLGAACSLASAVHVLMFIQSLVISDSRAALLLGKANTV